MLLHLSLEIKEEKVRTKKYLGLVLDHKLKFTDHVNYIEKKIARNEVVLCINQKIYFQLNIETCLQMLYCYQTLIT